MKQILITGGAGFIGSHLCARLLEEGNEVEFDIVQGEKGPQASNVVKLQG